MRNNSRGFTMIELLIVIVVIGILAGLVVTAFTNVQRNARDTERKTDVSALYRKLTAYYTENSKYPTLNELNNGAWRTTNFSGFDQEAMKDPKSTSYNLANAAAANVYSYVPLASGGGACDNTATDCTQMTLTATLEAGGTFVKSNQN